MSTLNNNLLKNAFSGISFDPERRAASTRADFNNDIAEYTDIVKDLPNAEELTEHYRAGLAARYNKWLASSSRCVSWFIAGPSKFPVRRQQKAMNIESKRMNELMAWQREQIRKAYALVRKASGQGPIMSSDADAPEQLRKKIAHLEAVHALVVAVNKQIRKDEKKAKIWIAEQRDKHPATVYSAFLKVVNEYAFCRCNGGIYGETVAPYWLSNDSQNIKRLKGRLSEIEKKRTTFTAAEDYTAEDGTQIEFDGSANRIRLIFEDKPEPEMREKTAPCSLACAADMLKMRDFRYIDKQGFLKRLDLRGVEKCTSWQALHDEDGILRYHTEKDEEGKLHRVYHFRNIAESFLRFSRSLLDAPTGQAAWKSCGEGNIVGYDQQNPARICSMAALWGMEDISGQFFRTPRAWKNAGYELKPTARPFFVVTPKFAQKNEKATDEETGEEVEQVTITGAAGEYNLFPVYCSADVVQVREIKRREPRKATQSAEAAELEAAYATAKQEAATATTGAPRQNAIVAMASPSKARQLTLAL